MAMLRFNLSSLVLALTAVTAGANPQDKNNNDFFHFNNAQLGGFGREYDEYCCNDFDRTAVGANHRVLENCGDSSNTGVMSACFCGLLQDYILPADRDDKPAIMSTRDKGSSSGSNTGALCVNGMAGVYPCDNVNLLSFIPLNLFDSNGTATWNANDIWGWTYYGRGGTPREYALIGLTDGTGMVEITDPMNPKVLGRLDSPEGTSLWRDIKIFNGYAFIVSESANHGLQVFNLRDMVFSTASFTTISPSYTYDDFRAHNIFINEDTGYAYLAGPRTAEGAPICGGAMAALKISDVKNIADLDRSCQQSTAVTTYTHDAQCVTYHGPDTLYTDHEICVLCNADRVVIVDVTDKDNWVRLSEMTYADSQYTHQGWLSPDHSYFVFGDEMDETRNGIDTTIFSMDVSNLQSPGTPGRYVAEGRAAVDHNLYIKTFYTPDNEEIDIIFLANYEAGMRVLKVNDYGAVGPSLSTTGFEEIGYFDTFPASDDAKFHGVWSVYPFFESGTVVISSVEEGLFVVRPDIMDFLSTRPSSQPSEAPTDIPSSNPSNVPTSEPRPLRTRFPSASPSYAPLTTPPAWTEISFNDFENGWGDFNDGGNDARRKSADGVFFVDDGSLNHAVRLRDDSESSIMYSDELPIPNTFTHIKVEFDFYAYSMEIDENFYVEIAFNGDTDWTIVENFVRSNSNTVSAFLNKKLYKDVKIFYVIPAGGRDSMWLRIRCDASGNGDHVYLDNVGIYGLSK